MKNNSRWHFIWPIWLMATSAAAEPITCVVVRSPTQVQAQEAEADLSRLADQYNDPTKPPPVRLELLRQMFERFPVPLAGIQLGRGYLAELRYEDAKTILLEVSKQEPKSLYNAPELHQLAVTESLSELRNLPARYQRQNLILQMRGAASKVKVWIDSTQDARRCDGPLEVTPGEHPVYWKLESPACEGTGQITLQPGVNNVVEINACETARPTGTNLTETKQTLRPSHDPESTPPRQIIEPREQDTSSRSIPKWTTLVAGGVSVIGVGAAVLFNLHAQNLKENADCPNKRCSPTGTNDIESAKESKNWSTAGYAVGGVGLGVAAIALLAWHPWSSSAENSHRQASSQMLRFTPIFGATAAGVSAQGTF